MAKSAVLAAGFIDLSGGKVETHAGECLLIENGRIVGFEKTANLSADVAIIDHSDAFCLPGLVDAAFLGGLIVREDGFRPNTYGQSVWAAKRAAETWLDSGVTTVGSMGASDEIDFDLARSVAGGRMVGPRIYPALTPLAPAGKAKFHPLYGVREVSGTDEARRAARELIKNGADRIVVYADPPLEFHASPAETSRHRLTFSAAELAELVAQARQAGCYVHAQAISTQAISNCIEAGVRSIGCAYGLQESHLPMMAERGIALAPNLALGATIRELGAAAGFPASSIQMVSEQRIKPDLLMRAHQAGVEIICGTNAAFLAGGVYRECLELVNAGLSAADALRAATIGSASALKPYVECGSFRSFHFADLIFLETDPTQDIHALAQIKEVLTGGMAIMA
jgi:imidazolonepropionase-like amidohydrolase